MVYSILCPALFHTSKRRFYFIIIFFSLTQHLHKEKKTIATFQSASKSSISKYTVRRSINHVLISSYCSTQIHSQRHQYSGTVPHFIIPISLSKVAMAHTVVHLSTNPTAWVPIPAKTLNNFLTVFLCMALSRQPRIKLSTTVSFIFLRALES